MLGHQTLKPGFLAALDTGGVLQFQYNPEEVQERDSAEWANISIHGLTNPRLQYVSGEGRTITFTLKLYHRGSNGKTPGQQIKWLRSLVYPNTAGGMPTRPPTRVAFSLGSDYRGVTCIVLDVSTNASMFDINNNVSYAEVTLTLLEINAKAIGYADVRGS